MMYLLLITAISLAFNGGLLFIANQEKGKISKIAVIIGVVLNLVVCGFLLGYTEGKYNVENTEIVKFILLFEAIFVYDKLSDKA